LHQFLVVLLVVPLNEVFPSKMFSLRFVKKHGHVKEARSPKAQTTLNAFNSLTFIISSNFQLDQVQWIKSVKCWLKQWFTSFII